MPAGGHPFDLSYILSASGRWNRAGEFGCLYVALDADTARSEYAKYRARAGDAGAPGPRELVRFEVEVEPVLDLVDPKVRERLSVAKAVLTGDDDADLEACRRIADWARAHGHAAIRAPSAAGEGLILAIYPVASSRQLVLHHRIRRKPL